MYGVSPNVKYGGIRLCQTSGAGNVSWKRLACLRSVIIAGLVGETILPRTFWYTYLGTVLEASELEASEAEALGFEALGFEALELDALELDASELELDFLGEEARLVGDSLWARLVGDLLWARLEGGAAAASAAAGSGAREAPLQDTEGARFVVGSLSSESPTSRFHCSNKSATSSS
jgi:hypothetical protein